MKEMELSLRALRSDFFKGLSGTNPTDLVYPDYLDSGSVSESFDNFIKRALADGTFRSELDLKRFTLMTYCGGKGRPSGKPFKAFNFDGDFSLVLFYGKPKNMVGVSASFSLPKNEYDLFHNNLSPNFVDRESPMIMQFQETQKPFPDLDWQRLLIEFISMWGKSAGFPRLALLPYKYNKRKEIRENIDGTAPYRYDIAAQKMGFTRENENAPYVLNLQDGSDVSLYKQLFGR